MRLHLFIRWYQKLFQKGKKSGSSNFQLHFFKSFWMKYSFNINFLFWIFQYFSVFVLIYNFVFQAFESCSSNSSQNRFCILFSVWIIFQILNATCKSILLRCLWSFYFEKFLFNIPCNDNNACWWTININIFCHCSTKGKLP